MWGSMCGNVPGDRVITTAQTLPLATSGKPSASAFALQHCNIPMPKQQVLSLQIEKSIRAHSGKHKTWAGPDSCANPKTPEAQKVTDKYKGHKNSLSPTPQLRSAVQIGPQTLGPPAIQTLPAKRGGEGRAPLTMGCRFEIRWGRQVAKGSMHKLVRVSPTWRPCDLTRTSDL